MAGRFTNLIYDADAYKEQVDRSTAPLSYILDPHSVTNCQKCFSTDGARNGHDAADAIGNQIDIDSVLRGMANISGKSIEQQQPIALNYKTYMPPDCPTALQTEYSRLSHPAYNLKGLATSDMRLDYPLQDPQCQIFENFEINTRLQAKDNHKATWQTPMDQTNCLPKPKRYGASIRR